MSSPERIMLSMLSFVVFLVLASSDAIAPPISRVNYGVVFEPTSQDIQAVYDYWTHTIQIPLPAPLWRNVRLNMCRDKLHGAAMCDYVISIQTQLQQLQTRTRQRLEQDYNNVLEIFPQQPMFRVRNRAVMPFVYSSEITKSDAETLSVKDTQTLERHIKQLESMDDDPQKTVHLHDVPFSSVNKFANANIYKLMKGIEQNHEDLEQYTDILTATFKQYSQVMSVLLDAQEKMNALEKQVDRLFSQLYLLKIGKLSPGLVSPSVLQDVMDKVEAKLNESYPTFSLAFRDPEHYYSHPDIFYMRHNKNIYITIKFPITNRRSLLNLYRMHTYQVPLGSTLTGYTQLLDFPDYLALSKDNKYHAAISAKDLSRCHGQKLLHCPFPIPLVSVAQISCAYALFLDSQDDVQTHCDFRYVQDTIEPSIQEISPTDILIVNGSNLVIQCDLDRTTHPGCSFCVLQIPCQCSLTSDSFYVPPRITDCHENNGVKLLHPTNLALIQQFVERRKRRDLRADTLSEHPLGIRIPEIKLFTNNATSNLATSARREDLSLRKVAQLALSQQPVYSSLAETILAGEAPVRYTLGSTPGLVDLFCLTVALGSWLFSLGLFLRYRELQTIVVPAAVAEQHNIHKGPIEKMF